MTDGCRAWIQVVRLYVVISRWTKYKVEEASFGREPPRVFKCQAAIWKCMISPVKICSTEKKRACRSPHVLAWLRTSSTEHSVYMFENVCACVCICVRDIKSLETAYRQIDKAGSKAAGGTICLYEQIMLQINICLFCRASDQLFPSQQFHCEAGQLRRHVLLGLSHASWVWQWWQLWGALSLGSQSKLKSSGFCDLPLSPGETDRQATGTFHFIL